jgi:hypothetical protein|tara:strand:- start:1008 stop:1370 length:363 start_codon:yes stop_codon:yes gene_type:complete
MIWLKLLSNPLTKIIADKTIGAIQHSLEKKKVIRAAEIEASKEVDIARIKSQDQSYKDEILLVWMILILTLPIFEKTRDNFQAWVDAMNQLPTSIWTLLIIIFTASFGYRATDKFLNRKK